MLRPEVAEQFELTSHVTRVYVRGHDYDLTSITLAQAHELVAVPGFDRLRRKNDAGPALTAAGPARAKRKKRA